MDVALRLWCLRFRVEGVAPQAVNCKALNSKP